MNEQEARYMLRLIETVKYLGGIAEKGEGRQQREDETTEQFVLGYVKRLEKELVEYQAQKEAALRIAEQHSDVVNNMIQQLTESQAREVKLREYIFMISTSPAYPEAIHKWCKEALALLPDDTALKEFKRKVLLEAADWFDKDAGVYGMDSMWSLSGEKLRRMAEE